MGMLAVPLVLAIEDAQERVSTKQRTVYVCACVCVLGVWTKSRVFLCYGRRLPLGDSMEGEWHSLHISCGNGDR